MKFSQLLTVSLTASILFVACSSDSGNNPGENTGKDSGAADSGGSAAKCISVADDLIADFKTDNGLNAVDGREGGFYVYGDDSGKFDPAKDGDNAYPIDSANGNTTCSGSGSFHTKATGFSTWGAAMGADFSPKSGTYKGTYDARKYKGVSFWAKGAAPISKVQVSFPDVYTDGAANPTALNADLSPCVYTAGARNNCSPYLVKFGDSAFPDYMSYEINTEWKRFDIMFADTAQDEYNKGFHREDADYLDTEHLTAMAIQVNAIYVNSVATANDFELWIDDVNFIK
jgi:hypothetical protein